MYILIGLAVVAMIVGVVYLVKRKKAPALPAAGDVATTVVAGLGTAFTDLKGVFAEELSKVPAMISDEIARLTQDLAAAVQRAEAAEANLAAEQAARQAALEDVKTQVGAVIASIGAQPAEALAKAK